MGFTYSEYLAADATCPDCGWTGKARELRYGEYYGESHLCELDCPACGAPVSFVAFPAGAPPPKRE